MVILLGGLSVFFLFLCRLFLGAGAFSCLSPPPLSSSCPPLPAGFVIKIVTVSLLFKFVDLLKYSILSSLHSCMFSSWQSMHGVSVGGGGGGSRYGGGVGIVDSLVW